MTPEQIEKMRADGVEAYIRAPISIDHSRRDFYIEGYVAGRKAQAALESRLAAGEPDEELRKAINVVEHNWPDSGYSMLREALTLLIQRAQPPAAQVPDGIDVKRLISEQHDSAYRAGALAGWNAANSEDPEGKIQKLIKVQAGDLSEHKKMRAAMLAKKP